VQVGKCEIHMCKMTNMCKLDNDLTGYLFQNFALQCLQDYTKNGFWCIRCRQQATPNFGVVFKTHNYDAINRVSSVLIKA
jgi:hypothetical protein